MDSNFSSRTQANGRMNFGTRRIKYIKAFTHWVQDFYRISGLPSIVGLSEVAFKPQLDRASTRSDIRKSMEIKQRARRMRHRQDRWRAKNSGNTGKKILSIIPDLAPEQTAYHYHTSYVIMRIHISTVKIWTL